MKMVKCSTLVLAAALVAGSLGSGLMASELNQSQTAASQDATMKGYDAHTEPNIRSRANFPAPGVVLEVLVKEGDAVKKGQLLMRLDDRQDVILMNALELEGKSKLKIEAAEADLAQKRVDLAKKQNIFQGGASSQLEVDEAEVAVKIREIQVSVETMTLKQKELEWRRQEVKVAQMKLLAPFDGVVEKLDLKVGETPEVQRFAATVVNNETVRVNVYLPTSVSLKLKLGDQLDVKYKDTGETVKGKVIVLSPVADAASETRQVRLELANPSNLPSGLSVTVLAGRETPVSASASTK